MTVPPARDAPPATAGRDLRFDLLRGLCVALMLTGHLGWPQLSPHFPVGWVTAADGFFLLSGATLGTVARRWRGSARFDALLRRLPRRALWLYGVNLLLVVVAYQWEITRQFNSWQAARRFDGHPFWLGVLRFDHPLALDVLPRYVVFLLASPFVLLALRSRRGAIAVASTSVALWLAFNLSGGSLLVPFLERGRPAFPLATWQLLFFGGLLLAYLGKDAALRPGPLGRRALDALGVVGTAAFVTAAWLLSGDVTLPPGTLGPWLARHLLGPLRLMNLLVVALLAWRLTSRFEESLTRTVGVVLLPLGQNALPAFLLHLPLLWVGSRVQLAAGLEWCRLAAALAAVMVIAGLVRWPPVRKILAPV